MWHSHGLGQALYIVEGIARIQARGGEIVEAHPGDVISTPPGEQHWHGATPDQFMTHLALWETDNVTWLDHVTDTEYTAPRVSTRLEVHRSPRVGRVVRPTANRRAWQSELNQLIEATLVPVSARFGVYDAHYRPAIAATRSAM